MVIALVGLVMGSLGLVFLTFWMATDHVVAHHNENLLQCAPWTLVLVGAGPALALNVAWGVKLTQRLTAFTAGVAALGLVAKTLPWFDQHNGMFIALLLPIWLGAAVGAYTLAIGCPPSRQPCDARNRGEP
jgi:hypothetical protein